MKKSVKVIGTCAVYGLGIFLVFWVFIICLNIGGEISNNVCAVSTVAFAIYVVLTYAIMYLIGELEKERRRKRGCRKKVREQNKNVPER